MYHCMLDTLQRFEGLIDDVRPGLGQYLYGHIIRNQILVDQLTQEFIFRLRSSRETDFDFLETDVYQQLEEIYLFLQAHRYDQGLIAVTQIYAAPEGRFFNVVFFHPGIFHLFRRRKVPDLVLFEVFHNPYLYLYSFLA